MLIINGLCNVLENEKILFFNNKSRLERRDLLFKRVPTADRVALPLEAFSHKTALFDRIVCP